MLSADSRALRFGDGIFETMYYYQGEIALWDRHMNRLFNGLSVLKFSNDKLFNQQTLKDHIHELLQKNSHLHARIRLTVFRGNGGLADPVNLKPNYVIQTWSLDPNFGSFNENGLQIGIYKDVRKSCDILSNIKHNNYLPPVMATFFAKENKYNDAILLNQYDRVCETTNANIFVVKEKINVNFISFPNP